MPCHTRLPAEKHFTLLTCCFSTLTQFSFLAFQFIYILFANLNARSFIALPYAAIKKPPVDSFIAFTLHLVRFKLVLIVKDFRLSHLQ